MAGEKNYENRIKKMLDKYGAWHVKFFANAFTPSGIPDLLCCVNSFFLGIEVKASQGRPSPLQLKNLRDIDSAGGYGILTYPEDFEQLEGLVKAMTEYDKDGILHYGKFYRDRLLTKINKNINEH